jgi:hypothetical protein
VSDIVSRKDGVDEIDLPLASYVLVNLADEALVLVAHPHLLDFVRSRYVKSRFGLPLEPHGFKGVIPVQIGRDPDQPAALEPEDEGRVELDGDAALSTCRCSWRNATT